MQRVPVHPSWPAIPLYSAVLIVTALGATAIGQPLAFNTRWQSATPINVTGVLTVVYADDFAHQRSELIYRIHDDRTGQTFRLWFDKGVPRELRSGAQVGVRGRANANEIFVATDRGDRVTVLALDPSGSVQTAAGTLTVPPPVTGDQKTLVIVANFRDQVVSPLMPGADCSIAAITDRIFTDPQNRSVDNLYRETSRGQVSFSGQVVGPYTLDAASTDPCDDYAWARAADSQAAAAGVDVSAYARKVYVLPSSTCPAAGLAELAVTPSRAWVFTCDVPHVYAHELGHNLGMQHASTETSEYGDNSDIMGMQGGLMPLNAPHKAQMGWLAETH